jgi:hypothetical protein
MRKIHCDGCGFTESDDLKKSERKIGAVSLHEGPEPRWAGDQKEIFRADLCVNCRALMLHTYFKVPMDERLELSVPSFIMPDRLEEVPEPQSLKA